MATLVPSTTNEHVIIAKEVTSRYLKGAADMTFRRRLWLQKVKDAGRVMYNRTGHSQTWSLEVRQAEVRQLSDAQTVAFAPVDRTEQLTLGNRSLIATDKLTDMKREMMAGPEAIRDYYKDMLPKLLRDIQDAICQSLFVDGNATGNERRYHGLESFMGSGTTVVADVIAKPSDSYAGQSTALGGFSGATWSSDLATSPNASVATDWPNGTGDSEYDAVSPLLVNEGSNNWGTGATDWQNNCEEAVRYAVIHMAKLGAMDTEKGQVPIIFLHNATKLGQMKSYLSARNFHPVPYKDGQDFGFGAISFVFEGAVHDMDYDVPVSTSYGLAIPKMELSCVGGELITSEVFHWPEELCTAVYGRTHGNFRFQPKCFSKIYPYAAS